MRRVLTPALVLAAIVVCTLFSVLGVDAPVSAQPSSAPFFVAYSKTNIATNTTTQVLTGGGVLHTICVNTAGASANVASVYDAISGTSPLVAAIDTTAKGCYTYDAGMTTGIRVITATGSAGDLTVTYRALR